jgi:two-component system, chemotaxis family, sensor kinase CheA
MTLVGELVLTRNQLLEIAQDDEQRSTRMPLQRLNHVTAELQEGVMKTRMQPIGNAWGKLPRAGPRSLVELGKKIELEMQGAETELDRQVLEVIKDPLTHMIRNSADHGIERAGGARARQVRDGARSASTPITRAADHHRDHRRRQGPRRRGDPPQGVARGLASEAEVERMSEAQIASSSSSRASRPRRR